MSDLHHCEITCCAPDATGGQANDVPSEKVLVFSYILRLFTQAKQEFSAAYPAFLALGGAQQ
jgi:hypothetical protein